MALEDLAGTKWSGQAELWLDPAGDEGQRCPCTLEVEAGEVRYQWSFEGKPQAGRLALRAGGADFTDTFHSSTALSCTAAAESWCLLDVAGRYAGGDETWGWRITLSQRPGAELVLQMTNVAPWGEEGRAVRMVCARRTP